MGPPTGRVPGAQGGCRDARASVVRAAGSGRVVGGAGRAGPGSSHPVPHFCQDGRDVLQFLSKAGACCESLGPLSAGRFIELQSVHRARRREVRFYPSSPDGGGVASRFL